MKGYEYEITLLAITVVIILSGVMIILDRQDDFDTKCRDKNGIVISVKKVPTCIKKDVVIGL